MPRLPRARGRGSSARSVRHPPAATRKSPVVVSDVAKTTRGVVDPGCTCHRKREPSQCRQRSAAPAATFFRLILVLDVADSSGCRGTQTAGVRF